MDRRTFLKQSLWVSSGALVVLSGCDRASRPQDPARRDVEAAPTPLRDTVDAHEAPDPPLRSRVALVRTSDRKQGVGRAIDMLELDDFSGRNVFLKPNFNSAHETPGSTHIDTLAAFVAALRARKVDRITLGDRSGMGDTRKVMQEKGIFDFSAASKVETVVFDELGADDWFYMRQNGLHWKNGFAVPRVVREADAYVQTCCLKTHRFGGHFTMALKNSVGLAAKHVPGDGHNYMNELHFSKHQRRMIAEINSAVRPSLIVLDGVDAFVRGGPAKGKLEHPGVVLAGTDPVAIDAVAVAILRQYDTTKAVSEGKIFELEQIARAVELGIGVAAADGIEIVSDNQVGRDYSRVLREALSA